MNDLAISFCCGWGHAQVAAGGASALLLELSLAPPWAQPPRRLSAACGSCQAVFADGTALKRGTKKSCEIHLLKSYLSAELFSTPKAIYSGQQDSLGLDILVNGTIARTGTGRESQTEMLTLGFRSQPAHIILLLAVHSTFKVLPVWASKVYQKAPQTIRWSKLWAELNNSMLSSIPEYWCRKPKNIRGKNRSNSDSRGFLSAWKLTGCCKEGVDQLVSVFTNWIWQTAWHGRSVLKRKLFGRFDLVKRLVLPLRLQHALEVQACGNICKKHKTLQVSPRTWPSSSFVLKVCSVTDSPEVNIPISHTFLV